MKRFPAFPALIALACTAALGLTGCGGSSAGGNAPVSRSGAVTITIRLPESGRLIPSAVDFFKVEIFDVEQTGDRDERVALLLPNPQGAERPYDIFDKSITSRRYEGLPLKNLIVRIGAYDRDPERFPVQENPPLAEAEQPFVPKVPGPNGEVETVPFVLTSTINSLEIRGDAPAIPGGDPTPLRATALADNIPAMIAGSDLQWSITRSDLAEFVRMEGTRLVSLGATTTGTDVLLRGLGTQRNRVLVTASYIVGGDTVRIASREVAIEPAAGFIDLDISSPPAGTKSVRVRILEPGTERDVRDPIIAPWEPGNSEPVIDYRRFPIDPPGTRVVEVTAWSRSRAQGALLASFRSEPVLVPSNPKPLPELDAKPTIPPLTRADIRQIESVFFRTEGETQPLAKVEGGKTVPVFVFARRANGTEIPLDPDTFQFRFTFTNGTVAAITPAADPESDFVNLNVMNLADTVSFDLTALDQRDPGRNVTQRIEARANTGASVGFEVQ